MSLGFILLLTQRQRHFVEKTSLCLFKSEYLLIKLMLNRRCHTSSTSAADAGFRVRRAQMAEGTKGGGCRRGPQSLSRSN